MIKKCKKRLNGWTILLILFLILCFGNSSVYIFLYLLMALIMSIRCIFKNLKLGIKIVFLTMYCIFLSNQIIFTTNFVFSNSSEAMHYLFKFFATITIIFPLLLESFILSINEGKHCMPSVEEIGTISFWLLYDNLNVIIKFLDRIKKISVVHHLNNLKILINDLNRHSSTKYVNNGTLTEDYFKNVQKSADDPYIYIIVSDTGSPASEIISLFTHKQFNHVSISFDRELKTIISYNGGANIYPPGLNAETLEFFNKKEDASILVYRLKATVDKKNKLAQKIREINIEGSSYNILGLVTKQSYKSNIMFCSQFVYKMLELINLNYFEKKEGNIKPTDFIELDYFNTLEYCYQIKFDKN